MSSSFRGRRLGILGGAIGLLLLMMAGLVQLSGGDRAALQFKHKIAACLPASRGDALLKNVEVAVHLVNPAWLPPSLHTVRSSPPFYYLNLREYVLFLAHHLTQESPGRFNSVRINELPKNGALNVYFVDCELRLPAGPFNKGSCIYVGHFDSIVCRTAYFEEIFDRYDRIDRVFDLAIHHIGHEFRLGQSAPFLLKRTTSILKRDLASWIVGHEISHAVLHKDVFLGSGTPLHFDFQYNTEEEEADRHFAQQIGKSPALTALGMGQTLMEVIHREYRTIAERSIPELTEDDLNTAFLPTVLPIKVTVAAYDYPLVVRAVRVQDAIFKEGNEFDKSGYPEAVRANLEIVTPHAGSLLSQEAAWVLVVVATGFAILALFGREKWFE